jgi:hypothetical protein
MIINFEEITTELTEVEKAILPQLIIGFKNYSKDNPIKEPLIVSRFNSRSNNVKLTGVRLRKLVNYIRTNGLLPLIATSKGYYVSYEKEEIQAQIKSLKQRASSIENCADGLLKYI